MSYRPNPDVEELIRYNRDGIKAECSLRGHPNRTLEEGRRRGYCDDCQTPLDYIDLIWLGDHDEELKKLDWGDPRTREGTPKEP